MVSFAKKQKYNNLDNGRVTLANPLSIFLSPLAEPLVSANRYAIGRKIEQWDPPLGDIIQSACFALRARSGHSDLT